MNEQSVRDLIREANSLQAGLARMSIADEAIRGADAIGDVQLGYDARMVALEAAVFGGFPAKALVVFGWLTGTCDRLPEQFPESQTIGGFLLAKVDLLWAYKWVVQHIPGFSEISRKQIEQTLEEMEGRYVRNGLSLRPVWMNRAWVGMELGEPPDQIDAYYREWDVAARDAYADCQACEQNFRVEVHRYAGRWEQELSAVRPLLEGELSCAEVPHLTISNLVMPMWLHGRPDEAARLHERGYDMCRGNRDFLAELAEHVDYKMVTGDLAGALETAEHHMGWVSETRSPRRKWRWMTSLGELFASIATTRQTVAVRLPDGFGPAGESPYGAVELAQWCADRADRFAADFDSRNGNDSVSRWTEELRERLRV